MNNAINVFSTNFHSILSIYLVIYCILSLFFKPDKSKIYCGIFAFCGPTNLSKAAYHVILSNMKLLGTLNDSRGGDNAGIVINNEIFHTEKFTYKFSELIQKTILPTPDPSKSTVVIGHCRKGSVGGKDHKNAHPFKIYNTIEEKGDWFMTGVHNGTISNWKDLAENYSLDPDLIDNDSKTILTILSRQRNLKRKQPIFRVLEQYEGYAVFIWYFLDEPNTMYVFKGASYKFSHSKEMDEERPLYFYECPFTKGIYFSSVEESLKMLSGDPSLVNDLECNIVYKIVEGKFSKDIVKINREALKPEPYNSTTVRGFVKNHNKNKKALYENCSHEDEYNYYSHGYPNYERIINKTCEKVFNSSSDSKKEETKAEEIKNSDNGSTTFITSLFDIPSKPLLELANSDEIYRLYGKYLRKGKNLDGCFVINKKTNNCYALDDENIQKELKENPLDYETRHFFEGYLVKDFRCMTELTQMRKLAEGKSTSWKSDKTDNFMSFYSNIPVPGILISVNSKYYIAGVKANLEISGIPYSEGKKYLFKEGLLISVTKPCQAPKVNVKETSIVNKTGPIKNILESARQLNIPLEIPEKVESSEIKNIEIVESEQKTDVIRAEDAYIIDANEEEILNCFNDLIEKCKEQVDFIEPYLENKLLKGSDLLSYTFIKFFSSGPVDCLISPKGGSFTSSPYYKKEGSTLVYLGVSKNSLHKNEFF